jgi:hypothetical protein
VMLNLGLLVSAFSGRHASLVHRRLCEAETRRGLDRVVTLTKSA